MNAVEALLAQGIDYAGLFPPANLDMDAAVANYQHYRGAGPQIHASAADMHWMLGSFVLPASRLEEFTSVFERVCCGERERPWTLSVVLSRDLEADLQEIESFSEGVVFITALEMKTEDERRAREMLELQPQRAGYVEFPLEQIERFLPIVALANGRAKLRTGGVTADAVPSPEAVAAFLLACRRHNVAFKATAGLHHAIRGMRRLTDDPGSDEGKMHGFINLLLAACQAWHGASEAGIVRTLLEEDPSAFRIDEDSIRWHDQSFSTLQLAEARKEFVISFGSCSFTEPVEELKAMQWI